MLFAQLSHSFSEPVFSETANMKFTIATLVLASVAYSQTIASEQAMLPSCSLTCLQNAITGAGCSITDYTCQCGAQKNAITTAATPCIIGACTTNDALSKSISPSHHITCHISNNHNRGSKHHQRNLYSRRRSTRLFWLINRHLSPIIIDIRCIIGFYHWFLRLISHLKRFLKRC